MNRPEPLPPQKTPTLEYAHEELLRESKTFVSAIFAVDDERLPSHRSYICIIHECIGKPLSPRFGPVY